MAWEKKKFVAIAKKADRALKAKTDATTIWAR